MRLLSIIIAILLSLMPDLAPAPAYVCEDDVCCEDSAASEEEEAVIRSDTRLYYHHQKVVVTPSFCLFRKPFISVTLYLANDCPGRRWLESGNLRL